MKPLQFMYRNHREEIALRTVSNIKLVYEPDPPSEYKYTPGWFLHGWDHDRQAPRTFDINRIIPNKAGAHVLLDVGALQEEIEELRKERVELQDENEMLRHELKEAVDNLAKVAVEMHTAMGKVLPDEDEKMKDGKRF